MLVPAYAGELAHAGHELGVQLFKLTVEFFALGIEQVLVVSLGKDCVQLQIERVVPVITRAVACIVADVKRLVTLGRLGQGRRIESIGIIGSV